MRREEVFDRLEELGVVKAYVPYHGGGDESFVEGVKLYATDPTETVDTPRYVIGSDSIFGEGRRGQEPLNTEDEDALVEALEEPIYEKLGEAFGDNVDGVDGVAVWKVAERRVVIEHGYLDWHSEELEV